MKTLLLLRHAKSSWADAALDDFDRPLAPRGLKAAPLIGKEMARRGFLPERALVSPARRTRETFALVAAELPHAPPSTFDRAIYEAPAAHILDAIRPTAEKVATLLVTGHNPGLEHLAADLASPESDPHALAAMTEKFPTAAIAVMILDGPWRDLRPGTARLQAFITPRTLSRIG